MSYFDSKRDLEVVNAGGFFCCICLQGKSIEDQSEDPRYCLGCQDILMTDKATAASPADIWIKDNMILVHYGKQYVLTPGLSTIVIDEVSEIATDGGQTTQGKDSVRHKISCDTSQGQEQTQKAIKGRKPLDLPVETVLELSGSGMSIRAIADKTLISRETVRRIINGQRVLVEAIR